MKYFALNIALLASVLSPGQNCVDSTLIDPEHICPLIWDPVCGCNGVTYGNTCEATYWGGVTEWTDGPCAIGSECLDLAGIDFGACDMVIGVALVGGQCTYVSGCGTIGSDGTDYAVNFFENWQDCESQCEGSLCIDPSQIDSTVFCTQEWAPVCGCNGVTYSNECYAYYYGGVTSFIEGECGQQECIDSTLIDLTHACPDLWAPVCGCNGVTYSNECEAIWYGGLTSWTAGECTPQECVDSTQIDITHPCPLIYDPVCGCNGVTYDNECFAFYYGGVTSFTSGPCVVDSTSYCLELGGIDFGDCDMVLGVALINGTCQSVSGCGWTVGGIDYSPYFFDNEDECAAACSGYSAECFNPNPVDSTYSCIEIYDPVCGCDSITYDNSCFAFYTGGIIEWTPGPCITFVHELDKNKLLIYPNPLAGENLRVLAPFTGNSQLRLIDASGRIQLAENFTKREIEVGLGQLENGIYIVELVQQGRTFRSKLVVK